MAAKKTNTRFNNDSQNNAFDDALLAAILKSLDEEDAKSDDRYRRLQPQNEYFRNIDGILGSTDDYDDPFTVVDMISFHVYIRQQDDQTEEAIARQEVIDQIIDAVDLAVQACMSDEDWEFLRSVTEKETKQNEWIGIMGGDKTAVSRRKRELKNRMKKYMLQHYADLIDKWRSGLYRGKCEA